MTSATAVGAAASTEVRLTAEASSTGPGVVEVSGTATVPDGAHVNWALSPASLPTQCPVDVAPEEDPCNAPYGTATVTDQRFGFRIDDADPGPAEFFVGFDPLAAPPQPERAVRLYGPFGGRMTGDQVVDSPGGGRRAQVIQSVTVQG